MSLSTLRNIAIIALAALALVVLPGGGNFAAAVVAVIGLAFGVAIASLGWRLYKGNQITLWSMTLQHRAMLYGGIAVAYLALAATSKLLESGLGLIVWVGLLVGAGFTVFTAINESRRYRI